MEANSLLTDFCR